MNARRAHSTVLLGIICSFLVPTFSQSTGDFTVLYKTNSSQFCQIYNGELTIVHCPTVFEVHNLNKMLGMLTYQSQATYNQFFRIQNQAIQNPSTYSRMDTGSWNSMNRVTYIKSDTLDFLILKYDSFKQFVYENDNFGYTDLPVDALKFDDFGIYKDQSETQVFIQDRVLITASAQIVIQFSASLKLNFRVQRRFTYSPIFDLVVCSKNNAPRADICTIYDINTIGSINGQAIQVSKRANITLPLQQCATNILMRSYYIVVACPRWGNFQGQIIVLARNDTTQEMQEIYTETGNDTVNSMDYFNIGASLDLVEHNWNHAQLFFTSTLTNVTANNTLMNYTHINSLEIFRFNYTGQITYRFLTSINQFRDKSNDSLDLGRIGLSIYNKTMLLTLEKMIPSVVKYMPVCPYNHSLDNRTMLCAPCDAYQYATSFNSPTCRPCQYPQDTSSFAAIVELVYCARPFLFEPFTYSYQSRRKVLPFNQQFSVSKPDNKTINATELQNTTIIDQGSNNTTNQINITSNSTALELNSSLPMNETTQNSTVLNSTDNQNTTNSSSILNQSISVNETTSTNQSQSSNTTGIGNTASSEQNQTLNVTSNETQSSNTINNNSTIINQNETISNQTEYNSSQQTNNSLSNITTSDQTESSINQNLTANQSQSNVSNVSQDSNSSETVTQNSTNFNQNLTSGVNSTAQNNQSQYLNNSSATNNTNELPGNITDSNQQISGNSTLPINITNGTSFVLKELNNTAEVGSSNSTLIDSENNTSNSNTSESLGNQTTNVTIDTNNSTNLNQPTDSNTTSDGNQTSNVTNNATQNSNVTGNQTIINQEQNSSQSENQTKNSTPPIIIQNVTKLEPCQVNGKDCIKVIAEMRSLGIVGYVGIVIVSIIVVATVVGVSLYYLCKYLKNKRETEGVVPLPTPEKNENLHQEISFILPNKSFHHPDDNNFLDVVQSFHNDEVSHLANKVKMLEMSRDRGTISKNSQYRKLNQPFPDDSRSRSYIEDPRMEEPPNYQINIEEIPEDEPEPLQPIIDMIEPSMTVLNVGYNSTGHQIKQNQSSEKLFSNKHFAQRNMRRQAGHIQTQDGQPSTSRFRDQVFSAEGMIPLPPGIMDTQTNQTMSKIYLLSAGSTHRGEPTEINYRHTVQNQFSEESDDIVNNQYKSQAPLPANKKINMLFPKSIQGGGDLTSMRGDTQSKIVPLRWGDTPPLLKASQVGNADPLQQNSFRTDDRGSNQVDISMLKNSHNFDYSSQRPKDEDETTVANGNQQNLDRGYMSVYSSFIPQPHKLKMVAVGKKGLQTLAVLKKK